MTDADGRVYLDLRPVRLLGLLGQRRRMMEEEVEEARRQAR